ncbi:hypothetical protein [Streptomyces sp. NPDC101150]|uniref:hypothetical protein n=1 Tax=Streptomyces sp. NPDC101150 TaxID=3366114 RepID=UPI003820AC10
MPTAHPPLEASALRKAYGSTPALDGAGFSRRPGEAIAAMSDAERSAVRRADFGLVFPFGWLVPELTCAANAAPPLRPAGVKRREAAARSRVVFADEPTGALDSLNGERMRGLLTDAARDTGTAVVPVTHAARVAAHSGREAVVRDRVAREVAAA